MKHTLTHGWIMIICFYELIDIRISLS